MQTGRSQLYMAISILQTNWRQVENAWQINGFGVTDGSSPYGPSLSMKITKVHQIESQIAAKNWNQPQ